MNQLLHSNLPELPWVLIKAPPRGNYYMGRMIEGEILQVNNRMHKLHKRFQYCITHGKTTLIGVRKVRLRYPPIGETLSDIRSTIHLATHPSAWGYEGRHHFLLPEVELRKTFDSGRLVSIMTGATVKAALNTLSEVTNGTVHSE